MRLFVLVTAMLIALGVGRPASASVINLMSADVVPQGHYELWELGYYAPYDLRVMNSVTYAANPVGSGYHWAELWSSFEVGLLPETSLTVVAPFNLSQRFDGSAHTAGFGDLMLGVSRRLWSDQRATLTSRVHGDMPVGNPSMGGDAPALGMDTALALNLIPRYLMLTGNFNYLYNLRTTFTDQTTGLPVTTWHGQRFQVSIALETQLAPPFTLLTEVISQIDTPSESNRQGVVATGDYYVLVAPGATWNLTSQLALQASVAIPVVRGGYLDSYRFTGTGGALYRF